MRTAITIVFILICGQVFSQNTKQVGELKLVAAKVTKVDTVVENMCGVPAKVLRLTVVARTKVQLSCNYGNPSKNIWDTIDNTAYICYVYDTTGKIRGGAIKEIDQYVTKQEAWARQYRGGKDHGDVFDKSFYVNGETIIPFLSTGSEREGDHQLFYIDGHVYKIILVTSNGLGCLSLFARQNIYFARNGQRIDLGKFVAKTGEARQILAKQ